jgi:hypothetical protein
MRTLRKPRMTPKKSVERTLARDLVSLPTDPRDVERRCSWR